MIKRSTVMLLLCAYFGTQAQTPYYPMPETEQKTTPVKKDVPTKIQKDYGVLKKNIFKLNMLSPIYSTMMLFYQHDLQSGNSFQLGLGYMDFNTLPAFITPTGTYNGNNSGNYDENTKAFFITPEYRYMLIGEHMDGVFVAPFLKYTKMDYSFNNDFYSGTKITNIHSSFSYQTLGVGIILGQQWVIRNKISMELYAGTVYNTLLEKKMPAFPGTGYFLNGTSKTKWDEIETSRYISTANIRGYGIRAGFTVGFLF